MDENNGARADSSASNQSDQQRNTQEINNQRIVALSIAEISEMLASGEYTHRKKTVGKDGRKITAKCWEICHEIIDLENKVVPNFVFCVKCEKVLDNNYQNGSTHKMNRHECKKKNASLA